MKIVRLLVFSNSEGDKDRYAEVENLSGKKIQISITETGFSFLLEMSGFKCVETKVGNRFQTAFYQ